VHRGLGEAGIWQGFEHRAADEFPFAEKFASRSVGEADPAIGVHQQECVAEGVEQTVALFVRVADLLLEAAIGGVGF